MPATTQQRLARLSNRVTLYETVATYGTQTVLVVYCGKNKTRFFRAIAENDQERAKKLVELTGAERITVGKGTVLGTIGEWTIKFTGRTQRDAIVEGEHPYLLS
jgi:hypothetical protein